MAGHHGPAAVPANCIETRMIAGSRRRRLARDRSARLPLGGAADALAPQRAGPAGLGGAASARAYAAASPGTLSRTPAASCSPMLPARTTAGTRAAPPAPAAWTHARTVAGPAESANSRRWVDHDPAASPRPRTPARGSLRRREVDQGLGAAKDQVIRPSSRSAGQTTSAREDTPGGSSHTWRRCVLIRAR